MYLYLHYLSFLVPWSNVVEDQDSLTSVTLDLLSRMRMW